jgi:hypothetical protein
MLIPCAVRKPLLPQAYSVSAADNVQAARIVLGFPIPMGSQDSGAITGKVDDRLTQSGSPALSG